MKFIVSSKALKYLLLLLLLASCATKKKDTEKAWREAWEETCRNADTYIVIGTDTIIVNGNGGVDVTKCRRGLHGTVDTTTCIQTITLNQP